MRPDGPYPKSKGASYWASWTRSPRVFRPSNPRATSRSPAPLARQLRSHSKPCGSRFGRWTRCFARSGENGAGAFAGMVRARSLAEELRSSLDRFQRSLVVDLDRVDGELVEIRDVAHRFRLIPAQTVFPSLERSVRDAAQTLGKRVVFEASGGEVRLDANVLASLRDALMHVVRNAVAHGVETEAERVALGKSPAGQVRLEVLRRGGRVAFVCIDDGRGIDVEAVRRAAVDRGLVPASEAKSLP